MVIPRSTPFPLPTMLSMVEHLTATLAAILVFYCELSACLLRCPDLTLLFPILEMGATARFMNV